jgi:hypothetical protein
MAEPPLPVEHVDESASYRIPDAITARANGSNGPHVVATGLSDEIITALANGLVPFLRELLEPLKQRIDELAQRPVLEDAGAWQERAFYRRGHVVSFKGSAWVCQQANSNTRPGKSDIWRLMVKSDQR